MPRTNCTIRAPHTRPGWPGSDPIPLRRLGGNADVFEVQLTCLWPALSEPKVQLRSFPLVAPGVRMHDHETALGRWTASTRMTICSSSPVNWKHNRSPTVAEPFT